MQFAPLKVMITKYKVMFNFLSPVNSVYFYSVLCFIQLRCAGLGGRGWVLTSDRNLNITLYLVIITFNGANCIWYLIL